MIHRFDVIVIGGGAAGFYAAFAAVDTGASVLVLERQRECLRKFAAAGNGRCNLGNREPSSDRYHMVAETDDGRARLERALRKVTTKDLETFYDRLGVPLTTDHAGRIYPYCEEGNAVREVLIAAAKARGVVIRNEVNVHSIEATADGFTVEVYSKLPEFSEPNPPRVEARSVILACGSNAAPGLGGKDAYELAEQQQLTLTPTRYALCPLILGNTAFLKKVAGTRFNGAARISENGTTLIASTGEFLFAKDGISGIAGMELARAARPDAEQSLEIDFFPAYTHDELHTVIANKLAAADLDGAVLRKVCPDILTGLFRHKLAVGLAGVFSDRYAANTLIDDPVIGDLTTFLKDFRLPVRGIRGAAAAQVVAGGVRLDDLTEDFAAKSSPGLYLAGELIDVDGDTGGFNLHWAFVSGTLAGIAASGYNR